MAETRTRSRRILHLFEQYAAAYLDDPRCRLKRIHTLGVLGNVRALCSLRNVSGEMCQLAEMAAILHDVGRFEQIRQYGTFLDGKSLDHGDLSARIVKEQKWLEDDPDRDVILQAVQQHNKLKPDISDPKAACICELVRDADKLDILRCFAKEPVFDVTGHTEQEARQSQITDKVYEDVKAGHCVRKADRTSPVDIWITYLAFLSNFSFPQSARIAEKTGFWKERFTGAFADKRVLELVKLQEERVTHENEKRLTEHPVPD